MLRNISPPQLLCSAEWDQAAIKVSVNISLVKDCLSGTVTPPLKGGVTWTSWVLVWRKTKQKNWRNLPFIQAISSPLSWYLAAYWRDVSSKGGASLFLTYVLKALCSVKQCQNVIVQIIETGKGKLRMTFGDWCFNPKQMYLIPFCIWIFASQIQIWGLLACCE